MEENIYIDFDEEVEFIRERTGLTYDMITEVLEVEEEFLRQKGVISN